MAGKTARHHKTHQPPSSDNNNTDTAAPPAAAAPAVAPFLVKTHQMVEDPATDDAIAWTAPGTAFVVWNPVELARDILPNHFKHNNFSSFVRQLNTYGFRKVASERWEFTNDYFRRGEPDLLSKILRRKPSNTSKPLTQAIANDGQTSPFSLSKEEDQSSSSTTSQTPLMQPDQRLLYGHNNQQILLQDNEKLKKENQILSVELDNAKRQCQKLMDILSSYVDVSNLNASSQVVNTKVAMSEAHDKVKGGDHLGGNQFKLFGVCLNDLADGRNETNNKRKRFCNQDIDNVIERPMKMAGFLAL